MSDRRRIIVVDDDKEMRDSLRHLLSAAGWRVESAARAERLADRIERISPDVVLSDVRMPGASGLDLLKSLDADAPPVVLISAHGDIPMAVEAMQAGAYSFIEKPYDPRRLLHVLGNAAAKRRAETDAARLRSRLADLTGLDRIMLGESEAIQRLREEVEDLADAEAPVMILGETGVGKDLVARALHDLSARAAGAFVAVNCAAIPADGFETAMFGAGDGGRRGAVARADGGTLFLDAVSSCPPETQAKLLRIIETRRIAPVAGGEELEIDFRLISSLGEPVETARAEGRLREDLLFRLDAMSVELPPLRARREDIPLLWDHFVATCAEAYEQPAPETTAEDIAALLSHDWPGNVRELRHAAERRVFASRRGRGGAAEAIRLEDGGDPPGTLREAVAALERRMIARALRAHEGRMDDVAADLGIGRRTLNEKIVKLGLDKKAVL